MKIPSLDKFTDEQLYACYQELLKARPMLHEIVRARLHILDLLEERGKAMDRYVATLPRKGRTVECH